MIWRRRQLIFWWLVSAAAVAGLTAWLALRWHVRTQHESVVLGTSLKSIHEWLHGHLELTAEQHEKLKNLAAASEKEQAAGRARILAAERELAAVLRAGNENATALPTTLQKLASERAALQDAVVRHYFAVCRVLDDSQRKGFVEWSSAQPGSP
jgi:Spy/CpxP family protein refolding chaperone